MPPFFWSVSNAASEVGEAQLVMFRGLLLASFLRSTETNHWGRYNSQRNQPPFFVTPLKKTVGFPNFVSGFDRSPQPIFTDSLCQSHCQSRTGPPRRRAQLRKPPLPDSTSSGKRWWIARFKPSNRGVVFLPKNNIYNNIYAVYVFVYVSTGFRPIAS